MKHTSALQRFSRRREAGQKDFALIRFLFAIMLECR